MFVRFVKGGKPCPWTTLDADVMCLDCVIQVVCKPRRPKSLMAVNYFIATHCTCAVAETDWGTMMLCQFLRLHLQEPQHITTACLTGLYRLKSFLEHSTPFELLQWQWSRLPLPQCIHINCKQQHANAIKGQSQMTSAMTENYID